VTKLVIALVDDLIFASRIGVEVEREGGTLHRVGSQPALVEAVRRARPALIVVDLEGMGFDGVAALAALKDEPAADGVERLAYGSHVASDSLDAATATGATALARSQFVKQLGDRIKTAFGE
jgi:CheY-like chemotaxis protein